MGDVVTTQLPVNGTVSALPGGIGGGSDDAHAVGKAGKSLADDPSSSSSPPAELADAETPRHGRKASRGGGGTSITKHFVGRARGEKGGLGEAEHLDAAATAAPAAADFPLKQGSPVSAPRPRSPSTESETPAAQPRRRHSNSAVDIKQGGRNIVPSHSTTDTETETPQRQRRQRGQQQQQQQEPVAFERAEIRRVGSTAESLVDGWTPSLASKFQHLKGNPFDTVSDGQRTLSLTRPASKRVSLSRFAEMFAAAHAGGGGGGGDIEDPRGGAAGAEEVEAGLRRSSKRTSLSRLSGLLTRTAGGDGTQDDGAAAGATGANSGAEAGDGEFDTENPLRAAAAAASASEDETLRLGRGGIPIFATVEGLGFALGSASFSEDESVSGSRRVFESRNPMYGVPAASEAGRVAARASEGGDDGDRASADSDEALDVDLNGCISFDDLRYTGDTTSSGSGSGTGSVRDTADDSSSGACAEQEEVGVVAAVIPAGGGTPVAKSAENDKTASPLDSPAETVVNSERTSGASSAVGSSSSSTDGSSSGFYGGDSAASASEDSFAVQESPATAADPALAAPSQAPAAAAAEAEEEDEAATAGDGAAVADNRISPFDPDKASLWATAAATAAAAAAELPTAAAASSGEEVAMAGDGATVSDNRISPFDPDNASLWATTAATAAAAAAELPAAAAASSSEGEVATAGDGAAVSDNCISPFDPDNASLWATTAATAAAAAAAAVEPGAETGVLFPPKPDDSFQGHRRAGSGSKGSSSSVMGGEAHSITSRLRRAASGVGLLHVSASSRVFPSSGRDKRRVRTSSSSTTFSSSGGGVVTMLPPAPHSSALTPPPPSGPPQKKLGGLDKLETGGRAPAFGDDGFLGKTPLVSPLGSDTDTASVEDASADDAAGAFPPAASLARARLEAEVDIETGGATHTAAAAAAATAARPAEGSARVALGDDSARAALAAAVAAAAEEGTVLPCAPSDEEKIIYRSTGRVGLISCAMISFATLTWGMWLFTIVTPAFYWFGLPAIFIIFYTACHYLGVAIWGRDFRLKEHAEVVRRSEEKGYRPTVDVFLPVCKEPLHLLANTWAHVSALDYPGLRVYVLDDGQSEDVKALAEACGFEYVLRANAPELKKAGNLRNAFAMTSGEAIAIFDADFCPRPDFLKETVPYLGEDPSIGIVQTPQYFRHRKEQTWIEQGAGVSQEFFYRMVQMNQDKFNAAVCVGSCGLYRREALEPLGGMAAIEHSEDMYTGYKMTEHGFKIKYVPLALAMGICPDEPQSFFMQQYRWCKGSATLVQEKEFWRSGISRIHKLCFLNGMLYYMATALLIFLAPLPILLLVWMRADGVLWYHSGFVVPSIVFAGLVMPLWSKQHYGMSSHRVKVIQCYAHLFAIKDSFMGTHAAWVPSGAGRSKSSSGRYKSAVRLMVVWNVIITALIVGGSAWRMTELTWYHFVPAMVLAISSFVLNMSTLVY